jgi:hypothetical protein
MDGQIYFAHFRKTISTSSISAKPYVARVLSGEPGPFPPHIIHKDLRGTFDTPAEAKAAAQNYMEKHGLLAWQKPTR